jgi:hypothetical protein
VTVWGDPVVILLPLQIGRDGSIKVKTLKYLQTTFLDGTVTVIASALLSNDVIASRRSCVPVPSLVGLDLNHSEVVFCSEVTPTKIIE